MEHLVGVSKKIEKIRKLKGFSQEYVAAKLSISQNAYSKIERGETKVTTVKLIEICEVLEVDVNLIQHFDPLQEFRCLSNKEEMPAWFSKIFSALDNVTKLYECIITEKDARIRQLEDVNSNLKRNSLQKSTDT